MMPDMIRTAPRPSLISGRFSRFPVLFRFSAMEKPDLHIVSRVWQKRPVIFPFI
jgi:hypothetical protein